MSVKTFTLNGSQTLVFNVPLERITGEKLFYGIYAESGRSIHLNTIYVYQADPALSVATDRQVYQPGETVAITATGRVRGDVKAGEVNLEEGGRLVGRVDVDFSLPEA